MKTIKSRGMLLRLTMYVAISLLLTMLISASALAGESISGSHSGYGHNHHIALFVGNTHHEDDDSISIGLDYEYRLHEIFGVGALAEYTAGDFDSWILGIPLFIHPYKGLQLLVAPGVEFKDSESEFLLRTGVGYQLDIGEGWSITPQYNADFIKDEVAHVYGLSIGYGF
jgi:hypothetical protein